MLMYQIFNLQSKIMLANLILSLKVRWSVILKCNSSISLMRIL